MDSIDEPSKWVCNLISSFDSDEGLVYGTGFLVNIPDTTMYCIMTAGHNIKRPEGGYATSIKVLFPNSLTFTANRGEFYVSKNYHANTTLKVEDESSVSDYGLITVSREKVKASTEFDLRGCAFSILLLTSEIFGTDCTIHGYMEGSPEQTKNTSKFHVILDDRLYYKKPTAPGMSGGPIFISKNETDIAIGIHNYNQCATRLTYPVILEMLSWIKDYGLVRSLEVMGRRGVYLHTTLGSLPNIVAHPGRDELSLFKFVVVSAAKDGAPLSHHHFAITPVQQHPLSTKKGNFHFLTVKEEEYQGQLRAIYLADRNPGKDSIFMLTRKGKTKAFRLSIANFASLTVKQPQRMKCECGCVTQDDVVGADLNIYTSFLLSPEIKDSRH